MHAIAPVMRPNEVSTPRMPTTRPRRSASSMRAQRLAVRDPEVRALLDALLGEEAVAILVPGHDALGRAADRIEDRLLGLGLRQQRLELRRASKPCSRLISSMNARTSGRVSVERVAGGGDSKAKQSERDLRHDAGFAAECQMHRVIETGV